MNSSNDITHRYAIAAIRPLEQQLKRRGRPVGVCSTQVRTFVRRMHLKRPAVRKCVSECSHYIGNIAYQPGSKYEPQYERIIVVYYIPL